MESRDRLRIDPASLKTDGFAGELDIVVPYTEWSITEALLKRAVALTAGLNARLTLVAVHTVPYAAPFGCPAAVHAHLVEQLVDLASRCPLPVNAQVVLGRGRAEGFSYVLKPESIVLLGARKHWRRTEEERLARALARDGHKVVLLHVE
ncbi:MAG: hypothetical protein ABSH44_01040 [Bryobacteraceae bacterium]|jgi:hypothetical protein